MKERLQSDVILFMYIFSILLHLKTYLICSRSAGVQICFLQLWYCKENFRIIHKCHTTQALFKAIPRIYLNHFIDFRHKSQLNNFRIKGIFLENDFWPPPPPINFVHGSYMIDMDIIDHVAAALGPLACPSRSARPRKCLN